jgi:hypothetical protein
MKRKDKLFEEIYSVDQTTNLYMVEIALDNYSDIFSTWDPAPFKRRELDPDLKVYLEGSSDEIPDQYQIEICFSLPPGKRNESMEQEVRNGWNNSFNFKRYLLNREIKRTNTRLITFLVIGFGFLLAGTLLSDRYEGKLLLSLLADGLFIGGWVFIWEAVSLFFFTNRDLYDHYRTYKRLQSAPVIFREAT